MRDGESLWFSWAVGCCQLRIGGTSRGLQGASRAGGGKFNDHAFELIDWSVVSSQRES